MSYVSGLRYSIMHTHWFSLFTLIIQNPLLNYGVVIELGWQKGILTSKWSAMNFFTNIRLLFNVVKVHLCYLTTIIKWHVVMDTLSYGKMKSRIGNIWIGSPCPCFENPNKQVICGYCKDIDKIVFIECSGQLEWCCASYGFHLWWCCIIAEYRPDYLVTKFVLTS